MKKFARCLMVVVPILSVFVFVAISGTADVPNTLNYQGTLTDNTGQPVTGSHQIIFNLYNVPSGATAFWTETQTVQVTNGRFSVVLGKTSALDTTKFTGTTYIGIAVDAGAEMVPRQQLTSVAYALKAADAIPKGGIIMWSGAIDQIPAGWALCDGQPKTAPDGSIVTPPNLRDRFIVGAGTGYTVGATGGVTTNNISHAHTINPESPSTNATGNHTHHMDVYFTNCWGDCSDDAQDGSKAVGSDSHGHHLVADTQGGGDHAHTVNAHSHGGVTASGGSSSLDNRPLYYSLAFIIKL